VLSLTLLPLIKFYPFTTQLVQLVANLLLLGTPALPLSLELGLIAAQTEITLEIGVELIKVPVMLNLSTLTIVLLVQIGQEVLELLIQLQI